MGKISNAIQMLNYLNTGNKYSVKDLATKLEVTERMVRYYKAELEQAGIPIETFMGPNGGYYIINTSNQYNQFNKYDLQLLENILEILNKSEYEYIDKYKKLVGVSIDIRTRNFTQCGIIITTCERSCVLWKEQIKNMMKIIKRTLLSLLKAVNLFLILSVNMALIAKIFTIGNISMVT